MLSFEHIVIWVIIYTVLAFGIDKKYDIRSSINIWGPLLTLRTDFGIQIIQKIAQKNKRIWKIWGDIGVLFAYITGVIGSILVVIGVYGLLQAPDQIGMEGPTDMLVIPGVNRFLPFSAVGEILIALVIAMIIHEGGHALYCALGDIKIKSTGLIFGALIPLGAFVEPDEEEQKNADPRDKLRMVSAGIMNNYFIFFFSIIALFTFVPLLISPHSGIAVSHSYDNSPAREVGVSEGDMIQEINGTSVSHDTDVQEVNTITTKTGETYTINGTYISSSPEIVDLSVGNTIESVNETSINHTKQFTDKLENNIENNNAFVTVTNQDGTKEEIPLGVYAVFEQQISEDIEKDIIIQEINGTSVSDPSLVEDHLTSDESLSIVYWNGEQQKEQDIDTKDISEEELYVDDNISGIYADDLGIQQYPHYEFYNVLQFDTSIMGTISNVYMTVILPIISIIPAESFGFPGFTTFIENFYEVNVGTPVIASLVLFVINVLYWTAWININLALFNCIPTFALDGGHILNTTVDVLTERKTVNQLLKQGVKIVVLLFLLGMFFGVLIL